MCVYQRNHSKPNLLTAEGCLDHMKWIKLILDKWPASSSTSSDDDSADTTTGTVFVVPSRAAASNAALCLRMWPPSACPVGNTTPQAWHRCTSLAAAPLPGLAPSRRSRPSARTRGRLWLVRWPPRAWNVANARPQVRHRNAPPSTTPARLRWCW